MDILLTSQATAQSNGIFMMIIFGFLYFTMIRPQRKEQNRMKAMLDTLEVGDSVLTSSGFYGVIIDISDDTVIVEFGSNRNCRIPMQKSAITAIEKPESNAAASTAKKDKDKDKDGK